MNGHVTSLISCKDSRGVRGAKKKLTHGYEIDRKCAIWKRRFSRNTRNLLRPQAIQEQLHKSTVKTGCTIAQCVVVAAEGLKIWVIKSKFIYSEKAT